MGLAAVLETERREALSVIEDPTNVLHRILPQSGDCGYCLINCIDWYGNTTFNYLQAPRFLSEWTRLGEATATNDKEAARVVEGIRSLAERLQREVHVYLTFYGD